MRLHDLVFPARDERFDTLSRQFSEPTNAPPGDNFVSNEDSYPRVAGQLARLAPAGGVYLGVGPDQNFTYIAHAKPRLAFILDYRRRNLLLHLLHRALVQLAPDRPTYLKLLTARDPGPIPPAATAAELDAAFTPLEIDPARLASVQAEVTRVLRPLNLLTGSEWPDLARIQARLAGPGLNARFLALPMYPTVRQALLRPDRDGRPAHWLANPAAYDTVRAAHLGDRIIPAVADFSSPAVFQQLGAWLTRRTLRVSVFYVSDVEFFLLKSQKFPAYLANLRQLPWADGALIVRSSTREIAHPARLPGDSSTTVLADAHRFLASAARVTSPDDLFSPLGGTIPL